MDEEQEPPCSTDPCEAENTLRFPPREQTLDEYFEKERQNSLRVYAPIFLGTLAQRRVTPLDETAPEDLPDAADAILLAHSARMVIRAVAKVEQAWGKWDGSCWDFDTVPLSYAMQVLLKQRDHAVAFFHKIRETQARIQHLGSICDRGKTQSQSKPRLPRARRKGVVG